LLALPEHHTSSKAEQDTAGKSSATPSARVGALDLDEARTQAKAKSADLVAGPQSGRRAARTTRRHDHRERRALSADCETATETGDDSRLPQALNALGWGDRNLASITTDDVTKAYNAMRDCH
jgi:hypothetical protein